MRITLFLAIAIIAMPAAARNLDGRYDNSPHKEWFQSLHDNTHDKTSCCADVDGAIVRDAEWSASPEGLQCKYTPALSFQQEDVSSYEGHYCVRYKNEGWLVPDSATIDQPNLFGPAIIWPICQSQEHVSGPDACKDESSRLFFIRCFIAGALT